MSDSSKFLDEEKKWLIDAVCKFENSLKVQIHTYNPKKPEINWDSLGSKFDDLLSNLTDGKLIFDVSVVDRKQAENLKWVDGTEEILLGQPDDLKQLMAALAVSGASEPSFSPAEVAAENILAQFLKKRKSQFPKPTLGKWPSTKRNSKGSSLGNNELAHYQQFFKLSLDIPAPWYWPDCFAFGDVNDCPDSEVHTAMSRYLFDNFGARIRVLKHDSVGFKVQKQPQTEREAEDLATKLYYYCPDIVDQGFETLRTFASHLMSSDYWSFWWD